MGADIGFEADRVYSVLVVDDDRDLNEMVSDFMRGEGYEVYSAFDALEGLDIAARARPDVILMDLSMPGLTGLNACERLLENEATAGIPVIIVSARCDLKSKFSSYSVGAKRYVVKPVEFDVLASEVRKALRGASFSEDAGSLLKRQAEFLRPEGFLSGI